MESQQPNTSLASDPKVQQAARQCALIQTFPLFRLHRDPVEMVMRKMPNGGEPVRNAHPEGGVYQGITVEELGAKWEEVVLELANRDVKVTNAGNALEGALSIRYCACCQETSMLAPAFRWYVVFLTRRHFSNV